MPHDVVVEQLPTQFVFGDRVFHLSYELIDADLAAVRIDVVGVLRPRGGPGVVEHVRGAIW